MRRKERERAGHSAAHTPSPAARGGSVGWYRAGCVGRDPVSAREGARKAATGSTPAPMGLEGFHYLQTWNSTFSVLFANINKGRWAQSAILWLAGLGHPIPALRPLGSETRLLCMALPPCWPHRKQAVLVGCLPVSRTQEAKRTPASKKNLPENGPSPHQQHWSCRYVSVPRGLCYLSSLTLTFYIRGQQTVSKAADSKYFRNCEPYGLWGNCSTLSLQHKRYRGHTKAWVWLCSNVFIYKNRC